MLQLMLLDVQCTDRLPGSIATLVGPETSFYEPDSTEEARVLLFGRCAIGITYCIVLKNYRPWSRIVVRSDVADDPNKLRQLIQSSLNLSYDDFSIAKSSLAKFYGFTASNEGPKQWTCYKIYFKTFSYVSKFESIWRYNSTSGSRGQLFKLYELTDEGSTNSVKASNELGLNASEWLSANGLNKIEPFTSCQEHYECTSVAYVELSKVCPLKILSFDCEMYSHDNCFPEVIHGDFAVAICASTMTYGSKHYKKNAFVLWDSKNVLKTNTPNLDITYCDSAQDLIDQFRDFVVKEDPDVLTGWNIYGFDMPFLWDSYQSNFTARSRRGSEAMHRDALDILKRGPFLTVKQLLDMRRKTSKCGRSFKDRIEKLEQRHKMVLSDPSKLPEVIASELRMLLRMDLGLQSETSLGLELGGQADYDSLVRGNLERIIAVMEPPKASGPKRFEHIGRIASETCSLLEKRMASSAKGDNTYYFWSGRPCIDLMHAIKDDKKLESNTLQFVAQTYLDPEYGKMDMTPAEMFAAYRTKDLLGMARMLDYCMRDADIPNMLIEKLGYVPIWIEKSRVTSTPLQQLLNGGQQRSIYNLLSRFVHSTHLLNKGLSGWPVAPAEQSDSDSEIMHDSMKKRRPDYQGATVIDPIPGYYTAPEHPCVSTLDFESLYPSIMVHFNLCPSVFAGANLSALDLKALKDQGFEVETHDIEHSILTNAKDDTYSEFTNAYSFVKNVQGVVPRLLQHLLAARKVAKKAMNAAKDEFERNVQNGRQLALKTSCNSVYGFFGVNPGKALCSFKPASAVTTKWGRNFLEHAKAYVEKHYVGSKVLYGDTDSIMISFGPSIQTVPEAYRLADEASSAITELLRSGSIGSKPALASAASAVTLANEKVYTAFLLIQKKNYAALKYSLKSGHKPLALDDFESCVDMKGIDAVRRDRSKLVKMLSENILDALLVKKDIKLAINMVSSTLNDVAQQKAPIEWFVLSKSLKSTYASENQPHVRAWKRMIARGDQNAPEIGSRMPYVIVASKKSNVPLYERTEHPDFFAESKLKYCAKYYLENARDVVERLLGPTGQLNLVSKLFKDSILAAEHKTTGQMTLAQFGLKRKNED